MRRALVSVLAAALLFSVSGCGGDDDPPPKAGKVESADTPTPSKSSKAAPMEVDKVKTDPIKDDRFGHTIEVIKVVRNFPFPETMSAVEERGDTELVLVNIKAKAGKKYFVSLADGDFRLSTKKDDPRAAVPTSQAETEMRDAGYPPFQEVGQGKRGSGWLAFLVEGTTKAPLFLSYKRLAFNNGDIPEKVITVPLTPVG
jgi:predicted small lipoprotein YifL